LENIDRYTLPQLDQPEQQMFGANEVMVEAPSRF